MDNLSASNSQLIRNTSNENVTSGQAGKHSLSINDSFRDSRASQPTSSSTNTYVSTKSFSLDVNTLNIKIRASNKDQEDTKGFITAKAIMVDVSDDDTGHNNETRPQPNKLPKSLLDKFENHSSKNDNSLKSNIVTGKLSKGLIDKFENSGVGKTPELDVITSKLSKDLIAKFENSGVGKTPELDVITSKLSKDLIAKFENSRSESSSIKIGGLGDRVNRNSDQDRVSTAKAVMVDVSDDDDTGYNSEIRPQTNKLSKSLIDKFENHSSKNDNSLKSNIIPSKLSKSLIAKFENSGYQDRVSSEHGASTPSRNVGSGKSASSASNLVAEQISKYKDDKRVLSSIAPIISSSDSESASDITNTTHNQSSNGSGSDVSHAGGNNQSVSLGDINISISIPGLGDILNRNTDGQNSTAPSSSGDNKNTDSTSSSVSSSGSTKSAGSSGVEFTRLDTWLNSALVLDSGFGFPIAGENQAEISIIMNTLARLKESAAGYQLLKDYARAHQNDPTFVILPSEKMQALGISVGPGRNEVRSSEGSTIVVHMPNITPGADVTNAMQAASSLLSTISDLSTGSAFKATPLAGISRENRGGSKRSSRSVSKNAAANNQEPDQTARNKASGRRRNIDIPPAPPLPPTITQPNPQAQRAATKNRTGRIDQSSRDNRDALLRQLVAKVKGEGDESSARRMAAIANMENSVGGKSTKGKALGDVAGAVAAKAKTIGEEQRRAAVQALEEKMQTKGKEDTAFLKEIQTKAGNLKKINPKNDT